MKDIPILKKENLDSWEKPKQLKDAAKSEHGDVLERKRKRRKGAITFMRKDEELACVYGKG